MTVKISVAAAGIIMAGSVGRQTIGSLGSSEDSTNGSLKKPTFSERHPKVVRSLTVVAYIFSVSLAAIVLSAYYVVLWSPTRAEQKANMNANTTLPCRGVTYLPDGEGVEVLSVHGNHPVSRLTYSTLRQVVYRPRTGTPPPQLPPPIPVPSKFVSNNSQSNNSSLQEESSVVYDSNSSHNSSDVSSNNASGKQQQLDEGTKQHETATVPVSPAPGTIILTRIINPGKNPMKRRHRV